MYEWKMDSADHELVSKTLDYSSVRLRDIARVSTRSRWSLPRTRTASRRLLVITDGKGSLTMNNCSYQVEKPCVYSCVPEASIEMTCNCGRDLDLMIIEYDIYQEQGNKGPLVVVDDYIMEPGSELLTQEASWFTGMCQSIYGHWHSGEGLGRYRSQIIFQEFLYWVAKSRTSDSQDSNSTLQKTKEYIDQHYDENLTLERLGRMAGLSLKYYSELFKKQYGVSVTEYIATTRMEHAKQLMMDSELKLRDIAHLVGYPDEFYFSRKFKKMMGVSPSEYKKQQELTFLGSRFS
ncbi:helix-turn-helix domain-containing protein [Paenibacillus shunpengii]|uniref:Helix-turn-helix domain-containing protein n=1 Tax=Paenibacillus shunpengii TaxID=2054424 RepID=A0ABW5SWP0_9BACL